MLFLIGTILEIVVAVLVFFLPVIYTRNWEYGKIKGIGKVYNEGGQTTYTLSSIYGVLTIVLLSIVLVVAVLYLVLFLAKKTNIIPGFVLGLVYLFPIGLMIAAKVSLAVDAKFIKSGVATYGSGTSSGYTWIGWLLMFLMITAFVLVIIGLRKNKIKQNYQPITGVKNIKINKSSKTNIGEDDFKM